LASQAVWEMAKEPQRKAKPKYHPDIIAEAIDIWERGAQSDKEGKRPGDDGHPFGEEVEEFVPADQRGDMWGEETGDTSFNFKWFTLAGLERRRLFAKWSRQSAAELQQNIEQHRTAMV